MRIICPEGLVKYNWSKNGRDKNFPKCSESDMVYLKIFYKLLGNTCDTINAVIYYQWEELAMKVTFFIFKT